MSSRWALRRALVGAVLAVACITAGAARGQAVEVGDPAINPPPISLKLDGATPEELASALSTATGTSIVAQPPSMATTGPPPPPLRHTIDAANQPFWKVYNTLHASNGIFFLQARERGELGISWRSRGPLAEIVGISWAGFFYFPSTIERIVLANPQRPGAGTTDTLSFEFTIMADPRIKIAALSGITFDSMIDSNGTDLIKGVALKVETGHVLRPGLSPEGPVRADPTASRVVRAAMSFPFPVKHGTSASLKGIARYKLEDQREVVVPIEFKDVKLPR
jgi:hypothetical protein